MTITGDDLRRLLDAESGAVLVLLEGHAEVVGEHDVDDQAHRGALQVITRPDLVARFGDREPSERDLADQAGALDAGVTNLGG